ncbi:class I SAM-dependent methyltransferase [Methylovulum psychrotolerans]|uniref:Methyltransferase type 11 n=1 Tax=Methylovulum psychrotolerans TaxID=1704499 RepID=A0A1Z4BWQ6_9GAMM|nr:class I SAM-dependent methyltransferase [Methylovulum psychrotolerans]ASF45718.1 methyltransferase type 11 [Methylovulum psychrotolerans]
MIYTSVVSGVYGDILQECVACRNPHISYWRKKNFHYTDGEAQKEFHIYRCANCGTGFLNRPPHKQWLQAIYQYSGQALTQAITLAEVLARETEFPNCTADAIRMTERDSQLNRSGNRQALDIGSGFGFCTHSLRKLGYRTVSINPGQYENTVFRELNGDEPLPIVFEDYHAAEPFGIVMLSQVLEHLLEPEQAIAKVGGLLAQNGVLACAVPNYHSVLVKLLGTKDNACLWIPEHVNYFTEKGLTTLLERNGFNVVKVEQITRIPAKALSKRLGLQGKSAAVMDALTQRWQNPFARLMNALGWGIYLNVYAVKQ